MRCCFDLSVSLNFVADCTSCSSFLLGGSELGGGGGGWGSTCRLSVNLS